jgi:hypothetical protein
VLQGFIWPFHCDLRDLRCFSNWLTSISDLWFTWLGGSSPLPPYVIGESVFDSTVYFVDVPFEPDKAGRTDRRTDICLYYHGLYWTRILGEILDVLHDVSGDVFLYFSDVCCLMVA